MQDFMWPDVFEKGEANYSQDKKGRGEALADANTGWGNCHAGCKPPENFGKGMVVIGEHLGETATPENISRMSEELACPVCKGNKIGPFVKAENIKCKICGGRGRLASPEMWEEFGKDCDKFFGEAS